MRRQPKPNRTRSERLSLWCEDALDRWTPVFFLACLVLCLGLILVLAATLIVEVLP